MTKIYFAGKLHRTAPFCADSEPIKGYRTGVIFTLRSGAVPALGGKK